MRTYNALPAAGGLLDQEDALMRDLDLITREWAKWERIDRKAEEAKSGRGGRRRGR